MTKPTAHDPVSEVDGEILLWLPADSSAPSTARQFVRLRWGEFDIDTLDDVELIITELVSNAVRHGSPEVILRMRTDPMALDVAVLDGSPRLPPARATGAPTDAASGRGLMIIEQLARDWGVEPFEGSDGKAVWASIARS